MNVLTNNNNFLTIEGKHIEHRNTTHMVLLRGIDAYLSMLLAPNHTQGFSLLSGF